VAWQLLDPLSPSERAALVGLARARSFERNEVVCHAGDPADSLHLVDSGHLAVRGALATGHTATFRVLSAGEYFGELALLREDRRRTATVVALEPSRTLAIAAPVFNRFLEENPQLGRALATLLADRIDRLSNRLLETMYLSLDRRVYRRLLDLAAAYGVADNTARIPLSQSSLADLVGATRPSVNQVLGRLVSQHLIAVSRGRIELLDVSALTRRAAD